MIHLEYLKLCKLKITHNNLKVVHGKHSLKPMISKAIFCDNNCSPPK